MNTIPDFLSRFENMVIIPGIQKGIFSRREVVPLKIGKLAHTEFGRVVGSIINFEGLLVIDYYGHYKKSTGFFSSISEKRSSNSPCATPIEVPIVHFSSIKDTQILEISSNDTQLLGDFFFFKNLIVQLRFKLENHLKYNK